MEKGFKKKAFVGRIPCCHNIIFHTVFCSTFYSTSFSINSLSFYFSVKKKCDWHFFKNIQMFFYGLKYISSFHLLISLLLTNKVIKMPIINKLSTIKIGLKKYNIWCFFFIIFRLFLHHNIFFDIRWFNITNERFTNKVWHYCNRRSDE